MTEQGFNRSYSSLIENLENANMEADTAKLIRGEQTGLTAFSELALQALHEYYVYALIDPRNERVFYIGKGTGNRVFQHEEESARLPESEKAKLRTIREIEAQGLAVKRVLVHWGLSESEAFAAEAALINLLNFTGRSALTNLVAGHGVHESLTTEDFEIRYGAERLQEKDIRHSIMMIKINQRYRWGMSPQELYDTIRGIWVASLDTIRKRRVEYVFGVFHQLIVAVYKPDEWHRVSEGIDVPRPQELDSVSFEKNKDRIYYICNDHEAMDAWQRYYLHKSIVDLKVNQQAQNPITYFTPAANEKSR